MGNAPGMNNIPILPPAGATAAAPTSTPPAASPGAPAASPGAPAPSPGAQGEVDPSKEDGKVKDVDKKAWEDKYKKLVKEPEPGSDRLVVVEFFAPWCGPSRFIRPFIEVQARVHKDVLFLHLNFDSMEEAATELLVDVVPTFLLYKGGAEKSRIVGARRWDLSKEIQEHKNQTT